jgi:ectoine hydroxylase-related dioxygenase (phytanoyl-CoA dioxygenase family)
LQQVTNAAILLCMSSSVSPPSSATRPEPIRYVIPEGEAEAPLYRSRYGGLWVDRRDAHDVLEAKRSRGEVSDADAKMLAHYIDHGYVVFPKAVDEDVIDEFLSLFEAAWDAVPSVTSLHWKQQLVPMERKYYDEVTKVCELHGYFARSEELIFPPPVLRFLTQIYERPPVAFQTMTMRKGSQENLHIDTGPLTLTEPMSMAASWLALEDVQPLSGEFQFIPGSHRLPEQLNYGTDKAHHGDFVEYDKVLQRTLRLCEERGLKTETFMAKKGDVLIWHADLMHGGAPIQDMTRTRKSLVAHFMPLGVMATFYDFTKVKAMPYPGGGYRLDTRNLSAEDVVPESGKSSRPVNMWRSLIPLSVRQRVPPSLTAWARRHIPH